MYFYTPILSNVPSRKQFLEKKTGAYDGAVICLKNKKKHDFCFFTFDLSQVKLTLIFGCESFRESQNTFKIHVLGINVSIYAVFTSGVHRKILKILKIYRRSYFNNLRNFVSFLIKILLPQ